MLVRRRDHLVGRAEVEPLEHEVAAVGRRRRQRDLLRLDRDEPGEPGPELGAQVHDPLDVRASRPAVDEVAILLGVHGVEGRSRERAAAPGLEVRQPVEHGELGACLFEGHARDSDGAPEGGASRRARQASPLLGFPSMRVVLADPPAYTPPYDRCLAGALAGAGADVELVTSRFRFGSVPLPDGYLAREWFYPLSSRMKTSRVRLAVKALEHPFGMAQLAALKPDVLHVQWLGAPEVDRWLFRPRAPVVFTAHDIIPRRTAAKTGLWRTLFGRCDRVVVHSERGRASLAHFGVPEEKLGVIPHPAFRSEVARADDGRTALLFGLIRPYKGVEDAVEAVLRADGARLVVAGDPRVPLDGLQRTAGERAEWRLGFLPDAEIRRALIRGHRSPLPLPRGDRRLRRASPGARRRAAGDRLRHRRPRRGRGPVRRGRGRRAGRRRRHGARAPDAPGGRRRAGRSAPRRGGGARGAHLGGAPRRPTWTSTASSSDVRARPLRRARRRQLDLFADDEAALLEEGRAADAAWSNADADESEELYGDYQLVVDAIGERLYDIREAYASTLEEEAADEYRAAFDSAARKRFRRFASFLEGEE